MSRIASATIQDIVERSDLVQFVRARISLKKRGPQYWACCPFHQEKTASFSVHPQKQFFYCFGCGAKGNVIDFLIQHDRLDFLEALQLLAERAGIELKQDAAAQRVSSTPIYNCLQAAATYFAQQLPKHAEVVKYLKQRGLTGKTAKHYGLGYAPMQSVAQLAQLLAPHGDQLLAAGLSKVSSRNEAEHYNLFKQRVMFPIRDVRGRCIGFGGRVLQSAQQPKYLNSPETAVFHKAQELYGLYEALQSNRQLDCIILVEGYMDVIALAQQGESRAVASLGTAIGEKHFQKLWRYTDHVICCFDGDQAGQAAAWKSLACVLPSLQGSRRVSFVHLDAADDPDNYVMQHGLAAWQQLLRKAEPLSGFLFRYLQQQHPLDHLDDRVAFAHVAQRILKPVPAGLLKTALLKQLAQLTGLEMKQLLAAETDQGVQHQRPLASRLALAHEPHGQLNIIERGLALLIAQPELAHKWPKTVAMKYLKLPNLDAFLEIIDYCLLHEKPSLGAMFACCQSRPELKDLLVRASFAYQDFSPAARGHEFEHVMMQLQQLALQGEINNLLLQAQQAGLSLQQKSRLQQLICQQKQLKVGES